MDDGAAEGAYRRVPGVDLRPDPEHRGCDIFTRRVRDIYSPPTAKQSQAEA